MDDDQDLEGHTPNEEVFTLSAEESALAELLGELKHGDWARILYRLTDAAKDIAPALPIVIRKAIELALHGDPTALRLCLERILPPRKERRIDLPLPASQTAQEISAALAVILAAVGEGRITPGEGETLAGIVPGCIRFFLRRLRESYSPPKANAEHPGVLRQSFLGQ